MPLNSQMNMMHSIYMHCIHYVRFNQITFLCLTPAGIISVISIF